MKYKLAIFDIDGTITTHVSSWQYIHEKLSLWDKVARAYQEKYFTGKISYSKFCNLDAAHWKGMAVDEIKKIFDGVPYTKNIRPSVKRLKAMGFKLIAVSSGLQFLAERVRKELGFDYVLSNRLLSRSGILTGKVKINIEHGLKTEVLGMLCRQFHVRPHEIISIGDTAGDVSLARHSGYSIAFNSSSDLLSKVVDYNCRTKDFKECLKKILDISG